MKYKIGDKVFIKTEEELLNSGWKKINEDHRRFDKIGASYYITFSMLIYLGKLVTISEARKDCYKIYEDNDHLTWTEEMFSEEKMKAMKIKKALETLSEI